MKIRTPYSDYLQGIKNEYFISDYYHLNKDKMTEDIKTLHRIKVTNSHIIEEADKIEYMTVDIPYGEERITAISNRFKRLFINNSKNKRKSVDVGLNKLIKKIESRNKKHIRGVKKYNNELDNYRVRIKKEYKKENKTIDEYLKYLKGLVLDRKIKLIEDYE